MTSEKGTEFAFSVTLNMECIRYLRVKETEEFKQHALKQTGTVSSDLVSTTISRDKQTITTVTRVVPQLDLPWMIRKTILKGQSVEFLDSRQFEANGASRKAPFTQKFQSLNNISTAAEVLGEVTFARHPEFRGEDNCFVEGLAAVSIPGMGKQIEKIIVTNLEKTYGSLPKLIDGWNLMGLVEEELTYFPEPEEIAVEEEGEEDSSLKMESTTTGGVSIGAAATKAARDIEAASVGSEGNLITSPRRAAQRAAALRELASKRNNGRARQWVSLSRTRHQKGAEFCRLGFLLGVHHLKEENHCLKREKGCWREIRNEGEKGCLLLWRSGICTCDHFSFDRHVYVVCTSHWIFTEVPDLTERSGLSIASMHDESNTISNEEIIEDAKWLGKRKNKYDDDDDNNNREGMQQGGNRKNIVNRERRIVENSSGVDSSSSSSNNAYKTECVDSNPSCAMWACDGECDANPTFMSGSCPCACEGMTKMKINNPETIDFNDDEFHLHVEWYDEKSRERRRGSIRIKLDSENAPKSSELVRETIRTGACARHSFCGASKCQFNRVENAYGLVQGKFAGIGKLGGNFASALKVLPIRSHGIAAFLVVFQGVETIS